MSHPVDDDGTMPFMAHLEELRDRLLHSFIAVAVGFVAAYNFKEELFWILMKPLLDVMGQNDSMVFTGLPEAFFTYLKVAFIAGIMISAPVLIYQFWLFVAPGLYQKERRLLLPIVLLSTFFFAGGTLFAYFIVFPFGFKFFLGFTTDRLQAMLSMKEYLSFASTMLLTFGVVFELPLVITAMSRMGLVTPAFLRTNRKYAILIAFIVGAILTPPDVVSQVLLAVPIMLLYELSILGAVMFQRKPVTVEDEEEDATPPLLAAPEQDPASPDEE